MQWFRQVINWGPRKMREEQKASLTRLLEAPVFELKYGDLGAAVTRLETMVRTDGEAFAGPYAATESREHA